MVGNGIIDREINANTYVNFMYFHGFINFETYQTLLGNCQGNYYIPPNQSCKDALNDMITEIGNINVKYLSKGFF